MACIVFVCAVNQDGTVDQTIKQGPDTVHIPGVTANMNNHRLVVYCDAIDDLRAEFIFSEATDGIFLDKRIAPGQSISDYADELAEEFNTGV